MPVLTQLDGDLPLCHTNRSHSVIRFRATDRGMSDSWPLLIGSESIPLSLMDDQSRVPVHLVGVCGSGMKALAELLLDLGYELSGSDLSAPGPAIQSMIDRGLAFKRGHHAANLPSSARILVHSPAIPITNVERRAATNSGIEQLTYSQMVGRLMQGSSGVCIAGTHGKSTTTAMVSKVLDDAGALSGTVIGAESCSNRRSGWTGSGSLFVAESCEFQRSFLDFRPLHAAILGIESDHQDCYPTIDSLTQAFVEFANQTADAGILLVNADCENVRSVTAKAQTQARRVSFGFDSNADWSIKSWKSTTSGSHIELNHLQQPHSELSLLLSGRHNVMNAVAAAALCLEIGVKPEIVQRSLADFRGVKRRLEYLGTKDGIHLYDDYAHHPTAVNVTLETLRDRVGASRIICVFQPHQILRTTSLMEEFSRSFSHADAVLIAPVFAARESATDLPVQVSAELARRIEKQGIRAKAFATLDQIVTTLEDSSRPGDVIVTMGAGDIDRIHYEFTRRVPTNSEAG